MQRLIFYLMMIGILTSACSTEKDNGETDTNNPIIESFVELGIKYGTEDRQFLDLYKAQSDCPTPIYFDAHSNGGNTSLPSEMVDNLNAAGISVISWKSISFISSLDDINTGWNDAELMFQWVMDNAEAYHLDSSNLIIGGSSRGTVLSWVYAHRPNPNIKGLYMYNALPKGTWSQPTIWLPTNNVTEASPPIYFVYKREPGCSTDPINPDIHDPNYGLMIVDQYEDLGIENSTTLVHSIGQTNNTDRYQFLLDFALSVIEPCN